MPKPKAKKPIVTAHAKPQRAQQHQKSPKQQLHTSISNHKHAGGGNGGHRQAQQHGGGSGGPKRSQGNHQSQGGLACSSTVDRQAAQALHTLLRADAGQGKGATLKSLTLAPHVSAKKATYAVTCEALKHLDVLKLVVQRAGLMKRPGMHQLSEATIYILLYELLIGEGLGHKGPAERLIQANQANLQAALRQVLRDAGAQSVPALLAARALPEPPDHPRWVRVNTLKMDVAWALKQLQEQYRHVTVDALLPDLLRLPPHTPLHAHPLVLEGALVLQSKASAMPAHALAPAPGWTCVDACAAPGNKTTHLAALMQGHGRIYAYDKDTKRLERLKANVALVGAHDVITARLQDFLSVDPASADMAQVRAVLLDPSCSGSGTVVSRQDHLLPSWRDKQAVLRRVCRRQARVATAVALAVAAAASGGAGAKAAQHSGQAALHGAPDAVAVAAAAAEEEEEEEGNDGDGSGSLAEAEEAELQRARQLAVFQVAALRHALSFPALERLVYSTCSIHAEENELVVQEVLPEARRLGFDLEEALPGWPRRGIPYFAGCEKLVRTDPYEDETDGFFVAVFARQHAQRRTRRALLAEDKQKRPRWLGDSA